MGPVRWQLAAFTLLGAACLLPAALARPPARALRLEQPPSLPADRDDAGGRQQLPQGRRLLQADFDPASWTEAGGTYEPVAGGGSWESGIDSKLIMIHANLMKGGTIVGWSNKNNGLQQYGSGEFDPNTREVTQLLDDCGVHDCKNAFCAGHVTTAMSQILIFGGHTGDLEWFRSYTHYNKSVWSTKMSSGRWYATATTLPDGKVVIVGGVADSGEAGYHAADDPWLDNPTYEVFDLATGEWSGDKDGMREQLSAAFPIHTYPLVMVTPDGGLAVSAGKLLAKYDRTDATTFSKAYDMASRPHAPWSYPQTGLGVVLPMAPPYDKMYFLAAGGTSEDEARPFTPASDAAHLIELTGGPEAEWRSLGPMPYPRVMGDAVILCDGKIGFFGGATTGIAGWNKKPVFTEFKDGTSYDCEKKCSKAEGPLYEPTFFDPGTGKWTAKGSLAEAARPRFYHSLAILLPDCRVLVAGSDVTWDQTAEIYSPPYFDRGPQPNITDGPSFGTTGQTVTLSFTSEDPVARAIMIRTGAVSHSTAFDARALWLTIAGNTGTSIQLQLPPSANVAPPGMYLIVLLSDKGAPSAAHIVSLTS